MQMQRSEITLEKHMSKIDYMRQGSMLWQYMTSEQKAAMSYVDSKGVRQRYPTWHSICMEKTGVSRPGKTARDRAKHIRRMMS